MKIGCAFGFIGVCGVFAIIAQLIGIIIPKVLVLDIELHTNNNITLDKFVETVHMEVTEEDSSDEDEILEIESLVREDYEYMHKIERLILEERNKERNVTKAETKQKRTIKRKLDRKIGNATSVKSGGLLNEKNKDDVTNLRNYPDGDNAMSEDSGAVRVIKIDCTYSSEETSSSSEEEEEEAAKELEVKVKAEDKENGDKEKEEVAENAEVDGDDSDDDDDYSSSCNESSESLEDEEEEEEDNGGENEGTESHSIYSSISIGLWNSYICKLDGSNLTECTSMSFPDVLHILKKDARGFIEAHFDLSVWHKVKLECVFSLVTCVLGLSFLIASVTNYFERRQTVALVIGSFGFVCSGVFTLVPVTRMMIVSVDAFKRGDEVTQAVKMELPWSLIAFSVCGVFSMMAAFVLISVTWYDRKERWRLLVRMTKQFEVELDEQLNDANIAKVYSESNREESVYCDVGGSQVDLADQISDERHCGSEDKINDNRDSMKATLCTQETIEIELTDMSERETSL